MTDPEQTPALKTRMRISNIGQLREALKTLPDAAPILAQVVSTDGKAWNMFVEVGLGENCGFKWEINPAILTLSHPELLTLPEEAWNRRAPSEAPKGRHSQDCGWWDVKPADSVAMFHDSGVCTCVLGASQPQKSGFSVRDIPSPPSVSEREAVMRDELMEFFDASKLGVYAYLPDLNACLDALLATYTIQRKQT